MHATVFLIPWNFGGRRPRSGVKNRRDRLVVLNSVARSVVEDQRGQDPVWVFPLEGKPIERMLQTAWRLARQRAAAKWLELKQESAPAGFAKLRVHDLKHTFGHRLEAGCLGSRLSSTARTRAQGYHPAVDGTRSRALDAGRGVGAEHRTAGHDTADHHPQKGGMKGLSFWKWTQNGHSRKMARKVDAVTV